MNLPRPRVSLATFALWMGVAWCHAAAPMTETSVDTVSGRVYLDANGNGQFDPGEKPLAGIRVTDSVHFATTGEDGAYTLAIADDSQIPYKPGRVVSLSWPSGKWPTGRWWQRLSEIKAGDSVDFGLCDQQQTLPFLFAHITDDHGNGGGFGAIGAILKQQLGPMVRFCINTGDLGYASADNMDEMFGTIQENAKKFPLPMFFTPGNHDMTGRTRDEWNQPRYGTWGFTKYLGPVRWSFSYGGVHFAGIDWADIKNGSLESVPEVAAEWLDKDLQALPTGTRTVLFVHFPNGCQRYYEVIAKHKVMRIFAGHNHQDREYDFAGIPATTAINGGSRAALLGVVQDKEFHVVHFCGGCKAWDYHSKRCALSGSRAEVASLAGRRAAHAGLTDKVLSDGAQALTAGQGPVEIAAEIVPGSAKRCGLRIGDKEPIEVVFGENVVWVAGTPVPFVPREQDKSLTWRLAIEDNQLTIYANSLFRLTKAVRVDNPSKVAILSEGGSATFQKVDVWTLADPAKPNTTNKAR